MHTGLFEETTGDGGLLLTNTTTVPTGLVHPLTVTVREYVPDAATVAPGMLGFCNADENEFGPVHVYVAPATAVVVRFNVCPMQIGPFDAGVGAAGIGFTITVVVPAVLVQPFTVTVTEYVPASAAVATGIVGFCADDVNVFGPVQLYVAPATNEAVRLSGSPSQIGELLPAVGAAGVGFTTTVTVPAGDVQPRTVTVSV